MMNKNSYLYASIEKNLTSLAEVLYCRNLKRVKLKIVFVNSPYRKPLQKLKEFVTVTDLNWISRLTNAITIQSSYLHKASL